jgi:hypothetical protein
MMMMVDIGAGTVDAALFSVTKLARSALSFRFYADDVRELGVMNLHRSRIDWLNAVLARSGILDPSVQEFLEEIRKPTDRIRPIPDHVSEYLAGIQIVCPDPKQSIDSEFFLQKYAPLIFSCIRQARLEKGVPDSQLAGLPLFLCGGGSRMPLYGQIAEAVNKAPITVTVDPMQLEIPKDLRAEGLRAAYYDRLSVAYGLSWNGAGGRPLGEYVRSIDIPPVSRPQSMDYQARYIDKSMT